MSHIIIKKSVEHQMLEGFEEEIKENQKILAGRPSPFNKQRAEERLAVIQESIVELKKQMANPYRHSMLQEGINPDNEELYRAQSQQVQIPKNTTVNI